ncbi:uroporphyrinogen-III synthase [Marinilabiliaceae bacterium ANBcel2]|nr:uroporphyrinogen-III synthase [Marinilabiliaceae bacterium ANBcel2]
MSYTKKSTVITLYPPRDNDEFVSHINSYDAKVISMPLIEIVSLDFSPLYNLQYYNWIVFTSRNGINSFFKRYNSLSENRVAVIGEKSACYLRRYGVEADFVGSGSSGIDFAGELLPKLNSKDNVLLAQGRLAGESLLKKLSYYVKVERVDVYDTLMPQNVDIGALNLIRENRYDIIVVTSPSSLYNLTKLLDGFVNKLRVITIGKISTAAALYCGIEPLAEAPSQSYCSLAQTVIDCLNRR